MKAMIDKGYNVNCSHPSLTAKQEDYLKVLRDRKRSK